MKSIPQDVSESTRRRNPHLYGMASAAGYVNEPGLGGGLRKVEDSPSPPKRIRQDSKPLMNKLEAEWFDVLRVRHRIVCAQSLRFMLGNGIWFKPDFIAWPVGFESEDRRMRAFEVKGPFAHRGGLENLKVAAHKYPQIKWTLVWKQDGKWQEQTVLP